MKTLADQALALIPEDGLSVARAARGTGETPALIRDAFLKLDAEARAIVVRRGKGGAFILFPAEHPILSCKVCHFEYVRGPKSKRTTCSRNCATSLGWATPTARANRTAGIKRAKASPEGLKKRNAGNAVRWADPEQRKRLSEWSKKRWADPITKAELSSQIRVVQGSDEYRELYSKIRKSAWADPEKRKKMLDGMKRAHGTPEARAKATQRGKDRWKDPVWRAKWTAANKARNTEEVRKANSDRMKARHKARREQKSGAPA